MHPYGGDGYDPVPDRKNDPQGIRRNSLRVTAVMPVAGTT